MNTPAAWKVPQPPKKSKSGMPLASIWSDADAAETPLAQAFSALNPPL
jgi:hypothetical protein